MRLTIMERNPEFPRPKPIKFVLCIPFQVSQRQVRHLSLVFATRGNWSKRKYFVWLDNSTVPMEGCATETLLIMCTLMVSCLYIRYQVA